MSRLRCGEATVFAVAAAGAPVEHWNLPDAHHTDAIHEHPAEYENRVAEFFDRALL